MTAPAFPPGRYGRRRSRRRARWVVPVVAVVVAVAAVAVAARFYRTYVADAVRHQVLAFSITSDTEVRVRFRVAKAAGRGAVCLVRARARDGAEVGRAEVRIPPGPRMVDNEYRLATSRRAITGEVVRCVPDRTG